MKTSTSTARGRLATSPALGWSSCRGVRRAPKPQEKGSPAEPRAIPAVSSSSCKRRRERGLCVWSASTSSGNISKSEGLDEKKSFIKSKMLQKNGDCSWAWDDHYLEKDNLWLTIRDEVLADSRTEPMLASFMYSTVLAHGTIEESLAFILANKLECPVLPATQLMQLFHEAFTSDELRAGFLADLLATYDRDPACKKYCTCLLYFKGFHAVQTHRIAHYLYKRGRTSLAILLQSRSSETFHVDIHPAAKLGKGIMLDHATGVVMGESTVVGDNVSMLHHVTLGGSGKSGGDRHPKIGSGVLIGAGAVVLGNVKVGNCSKIGAGSVVLSEVPPRHVAVGVPARNIPLTGGTAAPVTSMDQISFDI
mmetsp:Transcript_1852/g.6077  ORF Transcript_1852/g.6077 Transcript_1852/m.6077 type:complete len:365 (+) Transcript_1852:55-1149(+)|eukprot:CAMPEP_0197472852 /NCGR_PEP_ID=MMETSP1309-20131121/4136_1 /TAXON_ID=464262 /ORGANISM="Genus nov. species nov., Strain RCC998" /LENGTH=364 /DNA_ID=CAMNT_0043011661 /DNA_START=462 /DNA_END=1556 /DNA_ORIENTATION=-